MRRGSSYLIGYFFKNSKLYVADEAPNMISTLIILLSDSDSDTVAVNPGKSKYWFLASTFNHYFLLISL